MSGRREKRRREDGVDVGERGKGEAEQKEPARLWPIVDLDVDFCGGNFATCNALVPGLVSVVKELDVCWVEEGS